MFCISSCTKPCTCCLKSFGWFGWLIDELLSIHFFHPINTSSTWRHKYYWFWLISTAFSGTFWSEITHLWTFITLELEEILRNGKRRSSWFLMAEKFHFLKLASLMYVQISSLYFHWYLRQKTYFKKCNDRKEQGYPKMIFKQSTFRLVFAQWYHPLNIPFTSFWDVFPDSPIFCKDTRNLALGCFWRPRGTF